MTDIEKIYKQILKCIDTIEKEHSTYLLYSNRGFFEYKKGYNKKNLCLNIKIKENRKKNFLHLFNNLSINYKIVNDNKYYIVFELNPHSNYIILDFVVNSHIIIPKSFLNRFGQKTLDGRKIDYIDINDLEIKTEKTKKYGIEYGYYSKINEEIIRKNFESRIGMITEKITLSRKNDINDIVFTESDIEDIYNFFDITIYRNKKLLNQVNNRPTLYNIMLGGFTHDQLLNFIFTSNFPHVFKDLKFNLIINRTKRDFIINDCMISSVLFEKTNEVFILPINKKYCLALMNETYHKKFFKNGKLQPINIKKEIDVELINKYIFESAKKNNENVIGTRKELEMLLANKPTSN